MFFKSLFRPTQWLIECYCLGTNRQSLIITITKNQTQTKAKQTKETERQTDIQTNRQTDKQTDRQTDKQADKQTNKQTNNKQGVRHGKADKSTDVYRQKTVSHVTTCLLLHDFHKRIFF